MILSRLQTKISESILLEIDGISEQKLRAIGKMITMENDHKKDLH